MRLEAEYDVVTPLMLGGANQAPEFRLASFVNVVRWWWRFLALGRYGTPEIVSFWEAVLFGWSAPPFGRKRVSFRLARPVENGFLWYGPAFPGGLRDWSGINYLTAQAFGQDSGRVPMDVRAFSVAVQVQTKLGVERFHEFTKKALKPSERDWAMAQLDDQAEGRWDIAVATLIDAMALVGLLGGLGARSRRGFGSLAITRLAFPSNLVSDTRKPLDQVPATIEEYSRRVASHLSGTPYAGLPPYTALSDRTRIAAVASAADGATLMNDVGFALQFYRTWGAREGRTAHKHRYAAGGLPQTVAAGAEKVGYQFTADHDWYLGLKAHVDACRDTIQVALDNRRLSDKERYKLEDDARKRMRAGLRANAVTHTVPHRIAFGLPHNYFIRPSKQFDTPARGPRPVAQKVSIEPATSGRRASPLMLHFHRLSTGEFVAAICVAPAVFLPGNPQVKAAGRNSNSLAGLLHLQNFSEVAGFIDAISAGEWQAGLNGISTTCFRTAIFR